MSLRFLASINALQSGSRSSNSSIYRVIDEIASDKLVFYAFNMVIAGL